MKGPYDARFGNFSSAGVIDFLPYTKRDFTASLTATGGSSYTFDGTGQLSLSTKKNDSYLVVEGDTSDGYTDPGRLTAGRIFFQNTYHVSKDSRLKFLYAGYLARSEAADILPLELIEDGSFSRLESIDKSNRVDVDRHLMGITWDYDTPKLKGRLQGYYNYKETRIFSNYTFYYFNETNGDQLQQFDRRHYGGLKGYLRGITEAAGIKFNTEAGFEIRNDFVDQKQANTEERHLVNLKNYYQFNETALGTYLQERIVLTSWCEVITGLRYDMIFYNGDGTQDFYEFNIATNSMDIIQDVPVDFSTWAWQVSPKASVIFTPIKKLNIFLNFGRSFVSTQARQIAWEEDNTMPAVTGGEIGSRYKFWKDRINISLTAWAAHKEAEYVFDSEQGMSLPRGQSLRLGGDMEFRISPVKWLYFGTDLNYVHARFTADNSRIPNMAEWYMTNSLSVTLDSGFSGSLRGRFVGPRYHDNGYESDPYYIIDLQLGYTFRAFTVTVAVENLFNTVWYDSVFAYSSRPLQYGPEVAGLHVTPGTPLAWKIMLEIKI